jgi:sodium/potassium/calcium exchanger 6
MSFLFSTISIAASDFLCIDLSTLASILGLSESLTGVTFLAFGNGSPDLFSTFAAMRSNSGGLAVGELIGAASFVTSVVAGSMALVRPFKVARRSFVRDVGYFVIAVTVSMFLLADGRLHFWESAAMVGLYAFYVVIVVTWHWYLVRRRREYERDVAARTHVHIPENQELEAEQAMEDDDPGVASESRGLLQGFSTDDFDLLERADEPPAWKEEEDEDDEIRNRYLAEIRDNMHIYRPPNRSRRDTLNPIRPSLVGALEFQSILHSLRKSRNIRHKPTISLSSYSDYGDNPSQSFDTRSIASHPRASRPAVNDRPSPHNARGSSRVRAVSANDADGLKLDTSVLERDQEQAPLLTVTRPSNEGGDSSQRPMQPPELPRVDTSAMLMASPVSEHPSPAGLSTRGAGVSQASDLLGPPNAFNFPSYQTGGTDDRSPLPVSPRGTTCGTQLRGESPSTPFPNFIEVSPSPSSRPPSIRLPNQTSPSELLLVHGDFGGAADERLSLRIRLRQWWPDSVFPTPQQIGCTLFPTLVGWKSKGTTGRFLGVVAAPSVFLLTITIPVIEPQAPEADEPDPVPAVLIEPVYDADYPAARARLPADSPVVHPTGLDAGDSIPDLSPISPNHSPADQGHYNRPRLDSELPAVPPAAPMPLPLKDWNCWLVRIQLIAGPFFFVLIAWTTMDESLDPRNLLFPSLISLLFSSICLTGLVISTRRRTWQQRGYTERFFNDASESLVSRPLPVAWRPFLSLLGFLVAISWIATIATEVVSLLKTIGVILDISDSLLGLTVFAVGNSLGDLVANITFARLGYPVMALSACFGGPMLNILLGIGLGGLYMTMNAGGGRGRDEILRSASVSPSRIPYEIEIAISKVLVISGATLLVVLVGLLIVVPLNNWRMDRKIGWGLLVMWCVCTLGNLLAELA